MPEKYRSQKKYPKPDGKIFYSDKTTLKLALKNFFDLNYQFPIIDFAEI